MSDENQNDNSNPIDDNSPDAEVTLKRADLDRLLESKHNSAFAQARRMFAETKPQAPQQPQQQDPRVRRGLELLAKYEGAHRATANELAAIDGHFAAHGMLPESRRQQQQSAPTAQPPSAADAYFALLLSEKVEAMNAAKAAAVPPANPTEMIHRDIAASVAAIPQDAPNRGQKMIAAINERLRGVRLTAAAPVSSAKPNASHSYAPFTGKPPGAKS